MRLRPDPLGPQHDEREPGWFSGHFKWNEGLRDVQTEAIAFECARAASLRKMALNTLLRTSALSSVKPERALEGERLLH